MAGFHPSTKLPVVADSGIKSQVLYDCTCLVSVAKRSDFLL